MHLEGKHTYSFSSQRIALNSYNQPIQCSRRARLFPARPISGQARACNPRSATSGPTGRARKEQGQAATAAFRPAPAQPLTPAHGLLLTPEPLYHVSLASAPPSPISNLPIQSAQSSAVLEFDLADLFILLIFDFSEINHSCLFCSETGQQ